MEKYLGIGTRTWFVGVLFALIALTALSRWPLVREGLWKDEALRAFIASPRLSRCSSIEAESPTSPPLFKNRTAAHL
jgi:hypothetical protein